MEAGQNRDMEERTRKSFEGITNIIRFNWHFYIIALITAVAFLIITQFISGYFATLVWLALIMLLVSTFLSLAISFYVYDLSPLYTLNWLHSLSAINGSQLVNVNAGFDETSYLLAKKYPAAKLTVFDFYDPQAHTEISIARARKRYAAYPNTISVTTSNMPLQKESVDFVFAILSAHEIRKRPERILFFKELKKGLKHDGHIVVVEHTRSIANFVVYNIGFFHFFSKNEWKQTFQAAGLYIVKETKVTPFIHIFFLQKYEAAS